MRITSGPLDHIRCPRDVHDLDDDQIRPLCAQIRASLVEFGKRHGGHVGSNLAVVELTVALHRVFDSPRDAIIFDVSHQSYTHKMLTGRAAAFLDPRHYDQVTGFTNPAESEHDMFALGHTGTSISLACGMAKARDMGAVPDGGAGSGSIIAVIGDGALSSGVALEGLSDAAEQGGNLIVIVNDNEMSIAENHGGLYRGLARLRESDGRAEPNIFTALGMDYRYVEKGNDVDVLIEELTRIRDIDHPIVLHIHTTKGLGLDEEDARHGVVPGRHEFNHWQNPFCDEDAPVGSRKTYGALAMAQLERRFPDEPGLVVISPATARSNGITPGFRARAGAHYVDTAICEDHAAAYAAGIAKAGGTPVLATSATFFQRAYDQIIEELALNGLPATLLVFAAGISGTDHTHSGSLDTAMLATIPAMTYLAPSSSTDFLEMLDWSTRSRAHGTVAIRVPGERILAYERGVGDGTGAGETDAEDRRGVDEVTMETASLRGAGDSIPVDEATRENPYGRYRIDRQGSQVALMGLGDMYPVALETARSLERLTGGAVRPTVVDPRQCSGIDAGTLDGLAATHRLVVTLEDGQVDGGWGERIASYVTSMDRPGSHGPHDAQPQVICLGAGKEFTNRIPLPDLERRYGLTPDAVARRVVKALSLG
ncbi:MAG: 1-deoxy-D-xylulose-5-phosphate synthase [Bifidobacterium minimum]|jgi:1-deoxy-D-xylulose-5-phosphate synthase|nr:1-deoxy-D-xylulose-5-phosphate synthase [Bifidobacterium minimum]